MVEIGNFIAHRGERKIGIITREARDFFSTARFYSDYVYRKRPLNLLDLPKNVSDLLANSFRRIPNGVIRQQLNMNRQTADTPSISE